jgi:hypothetical protein
MVDRLALFLQRAAGRRFQLGEFDCGLLLADWCFEVSGIDPTAALRGKYRSVDEVQKLIGVSNLPHAFGRMLLAAGFRLTKTPVYGDVAMIKPAGSDICGAIVTTGYVVLTRGGGLSRIRRDHARLVAAWSVGGAGGVDPQGLERSAMLRRFDCLRLGFLNCLVQAERSDNERKQPHDSPSQRRSGGDRPGDDQAADNDYADRYQKREHCIHDTRPILNGVEPFDARLAEPR